MDAIKEESVGYLFNVDVQVEAAPPEDEAELVESGPSEPGQEAAPQISARGLRDARQPQQLAYSAPTVDGDTSSGGVAVTADDVDDPYANVGRNELCPCGSGRKFKRCHGDPASRAART
jgi:preprotein translocase subunit SecA